MSTTEERIRRGLARPTAFGRAEGVESLIQRQEAAERRLSSSLQQAESVNAALRALDQQLVDMGEAEAEFLRATARALLVVAFRREDYDVTLVPASCAFGLRVRSTTSGLQAEVTKTGGADDSRLEDRERDRAGGEPKTP